MEKSRYEPFWVRRFLGKRDACRDEIEESYGTPSRGGTFAGFIVWSTKVWDEVHCFLVAVSSLWFVPATAAIWLVLGPTADALKQFPIARYELAGSSGRAEEIVSEAVREGLLDSPAAVAEAIRQSIAWDWALIPLYVSAISVGLLFVRPQFQSPWAKTVIRTVAVGVVFAGLLDVVENLAILQHLDGGPVSLSVLTAAAAWIKFTLLLFALVFLGLGLLYWVLRRVLSTLGTIVAALIPVLRGNSMGLISQRLPEPDPRSPGPAPPRHPVPGQERVGVCSSGGGIRSAAYSLGAYQALEDQGVWARVDLLSAVSGGAYMAGAMTVVSKPLSRGQGEPPYQPQTPEERHLRKNSQYLAPTLISKLGLIGRLLLGLGFSFALIGSLLAIIALPWGALMSSEVLYRSLPKSTGDPFPVPAAWEAIGLAAGLAVIVGMLSVIGRAINTHDRLRASLQRGSILLFSVSLALLLTLVVVPYALAQGFTGLLSGAFVAVQSIGASLLALGAARALVASKPSWLGRVAGGLIAPLMALVAVLALAGAGANAGDDLVVLIGGAALVFVLIVTFADLNTWSLHPFYRRRLTKTFGSVRAGDEVRPMDEDEEALSFYLTRGYGPELLVCAAINVTDVGALPPGRNSISVTFSGSEIRAPGLDAIDTAAAEKLLGWRAEDIALPSAVAISGAAISPAMGRMTMKSIQALLALANVRTGVWLPNPRWLTALEYDRQMAEREFEDRLKRREDKASLRARPLAEKGIKASMTSVRSFAGTVEENVRRELEIANSRRWNERVRATYLFKEMFGLYRLSDKFVYVSDGGHWENLGLVELLRRGCTKIYCFDASGDSPETFQRLSDAVSLARTELGVELGEIDPYRIKATDADAESSEDESGKKSQPLWRAQADHVVHPFVYEETGRKGCIVYCKTAVTNDAPFDVREYQERNRAFPNHSTADQFFDEDQFEAYRALGYHTAFKAVDSLEAECHDAPGGAARPTSGKDLDKPPIKEQ